MDGRCGALVLVSALPHLLEQVIDSWRSAFQELVSFVAIIGGPRNNRKEIPELSYNGILR